MTANILSISLSLLCFLSSAFLVILPSHGQNSPQDYLDVHNAARSNVGVGPMLWDSTVAAYALNYANQRKGDCNLIHSNTDYGENLAKGYRNFSGAEAASLWVAEKPYYDYHQDACVGGRECLHYTQVVWRDSVRLGCARVQCLNKLWWFVICNYDPTGNYVGERPY
nr:pathogenesis-related leaf protein 6-like [Coffea arabica]